MRLGFLVLLALVTVGAAMFAYDKLLAWREENWRKGRRQRRLEERRAWDEQSRSDD